MSQTVETRVVEMRFDNDQFERGVRTSMATLEKLKSNLKLEDSAEGFKNINKAANSVSFDGIAAGVEALQKRFSTLGIVGMRVIENITDSAMNMLGKATSYVNDGIIQGGKNRAMNLENAHFQLQGLLKDEQAVSAVMKNVTDSVDGTAYSLDAAAKVASQLAASGMRAGDEMFAALRGVAGVAAMTNSEYEDIGRIYTQVAGQGRLMSTQLLQLSTRGMNAAATLAEHLGVTEAKVREMVTKGKIDFKTFAEAMDSAFGEHAKKANETFTGAASNIRAALARIGALFISPLIEQNGALVQLFNAIRVKINDIKNSIGPVADFFVNSVTAMANALTKLLTEFDFKNAIEKITHIFSSKWGQFEKRLNSVGVSTENFQKKLKDVAGQHGISLDDLINKYGSLKKVIKSGAISKNIIVETLQKIAASGDDVSDITAKLETFNNVAGQIIRGNYGNGAARVKALTEAGYDYAAMQKVVNYVWTRNGHTWENCSVTAEELMNALGDLSEEELKNIGYSKEEAEKIRLLAEEAEKSGTPLSELIDQLQRPSPKDLFFSAIHNALTGLSSVFGAVKKAWTDMVKPLSADVFSGLAETIYAFSQKLILSEDQIEALTRVFKGLFAALDMVRIFIGGAFSVGLRVINAVLSSFGISLLDVTAAVGDFIVKIRDWIKEHNFLKAALDVVVPIIKKVVTAVANWVRNNELIQNGIKKLGSLLDSVASKIGSWIDGLKETDNVPKYIVSGLVKGIKGGISLVSKTMVEFGKAILSAIKDVLGIHSPSTEFFEIGSNIIAGLWNGLKSGVSGLLSFIGDIGTKIIEIFNGIDFGKIFAVGISASVVYIAVNMMKLLKAFAAPAAGIGHMTKSIGDFFGSLSERIKPSKLKNISSAVKDLAIAIGILSASIYVLAQLDVGKMWGAVGAIAALATVMIGMSLAASKLGSVGGNFKQLALTLVAISTALYMMTSAIKKLEFINADNVGPIMGVFGAMILGFVAVLAAMSALANSRGGKDISKCGLLILGISAAMLLMANVMKQISGMSSGDITKGMVCIALFGGIITALMAATKITGGEVDKIGTSLLKISAAILLMSVVMKSVSKMSAGEIAKGITCIALFGGIITGLMAATRLLDKDPGKIGSTILGISAAMTLMALTIKMVATMSVGDIAKGVACLAAFGGIVAGLVAATKLAGGNNMKGVATTLLAMSLSIGILGAIAVALSLVDAGALMKGISAVAALSTLMTAMIYATKGAQNCKGNIIAMSAAIGIMTAAIIALSFVDPLKLVTVTGCLTAIMGVFALTVKAASKSKGAVASIAVMTLAIGLLGGVLMMMSKLPIKPVLASTAALSTLLLTMAASLSIIKTVGKVSASAVGSLALVGAVVAELALILGVIAALNVTPSLETTIALSLLLATMTATLPVLGIVGKMAKEALIGIVALAALIAAVGGVMVGLGALTKIEGFQELLDNGLSTLQEIGYGLGSFFGNIVSGFSDGATESLPEIATRLSQFMINLQPFLDGIAQINVGSLAGIATLVGIILALTAAEFIDRISSFVLGSSSIDSFGAKLEPFGKSIVDFCNSIKGINTAGVDGAIYVAKGLVEIANAIPNGGGFLGKIVGENNIDEFGKRLPAFGQSLAEFCQNVVGIQTSGIEGALQAAKGLAEVANVIPNNGGWLGAIVGENNIDEWGQRLPSFGKSLVEFCNSVVGINTTGVDGAIQAAKGLTEVAKAIPNEGGFLGKLVGENNADQFGEHLKGFGEGLVEFCESVQDIGGKTAGVNDAISVAQAIVGIKIPNQGGILSWFTGDNTLSMFAAELIPFGEDLVAFCEVVKDINSSGLETAIKAADSILNMRIPNEGGLVSWFTGDNKLDTFAGKLPGFGMALALFAQQISPIPGDVADKVVKICESLTVLSSLANSNMNTIGFDVKLADLIGMFSIAAQAISSSASEFETAGSDLMTALGKGIDGQKFKLLVTIFSIVSDAANGLKGGYGEFYEAGKYVAEGFAKGISDNSYLGAAQAAAMMSEANAAARKEGKIQSPSRAFMAIGRYIGEGLAIGIRDSAWLAVNQAEWTVNRIKTITKKSFKNVEKWVDEVKFFDEITLEEELELWETMISKYKAGTEERLKAEKNAYTAYKSLLEKRYQQSTNWIDKEKEYNRLSVEEEIEAWKRVQERYREGTDERAEIDKKLYDLKHELIDGSITLIDQEIEAQKELISTLQEGTVVYRNAAKELEYLEKLRASAAYEHSKDWMDEEEAYDRLGKAAKLAAYRRILEDHKDDEAISKEVKREIYKLNKDLYEDYKSYLDDKKSIEEDYNEQRKQLEEDYYDKEKEIKEKLANDIDDLNKKYDDALKSRSDALYKSYSLFEEVKKKDKVNSSTLMKNLQDQTAELEDWTDMMNLLAGRGVNKEFIAELQALGPSAISEIKALYSMSDSQLSQYVTLWSDKHKLANDRATDELVDLRKSTNAEIDNLKSQAEKDIEKYKKLWDTSLAELNSNCEKKLTDLSTTFKKTVGLIPEYTEDELKKMSEDVTNIMTLAGWDSVGQAIVNGITSGIDSNKKSIENAILNMGPSLSSAAMSLSDVAQSSILPLMALRYGVSGIKDTILNMGPSLSSAAMSLSDVAQLSVMPLMALRYDISDSVSDSLKKTGNDAVVEVTKTVGKISDIINGDTVISPSISPVIDMTTVETGISQIYTELTAQKSIEMGMQLEMANQNAQLSSINGNIAKLAETNAIANEQMSKAISGLRDDLDSLVDEVSRMQVVIDGEALVGAISTDMDKSLGVAAIMKRRGV